MTRRSILIWLGLILALSFALRIITLPTVFGYGFTNFLEADAWYYMQTAKHMATLPFGDALSYMVHNNNLWGWTIAMLSHAIPIEIVGAWLPVVVGLLTIALVFLIGKELFGDKVGLFAALFVSIIPSEFFHRSLLGYADHHVLEVLAMAAIIYCLIRLTKEQKLVSKWTLFTILSMVVFILNSASDLYLLILLLALFGIAVLVVNRLTHQRLYASLPQLAMPLVIGLVVYLPVGGYERFLFFIPGQQTLATQTTREIIQTVFAPTGDRTISELMPLLYPYGKLSTAVIVSNLHLFVITFLAGIPFLWYYRRNKAALILIVWTLVTVVITLNERRFMYFLTLPIALISALAISEVAKHIKGRHFANMVVLAIPLFALSIPLDINIGKSDPTAMTPEWHEALVELKAQPGYGNVTAWGDYGHWITYVTEKPVNYMPGPGGELAAKLFLSTTEGEPLKLLREMKTQYLILDRATLERKVVAILSVAGLPRSWNNFSSAFAYQVFYDGKVPGFLEPVYQSTNIRIYRFVLNGA